MLLAEFGTPDSLLNDVSVCEVGVLGMEVG